MMNQWIINLLCIVIEIHFTYIYTYIEKRQDKFNLSIFYKQILICSTGWKFASQIQGFYCVCAIQLTLNKTAECSWQCLGNNNINCGGSGEIADVYQLGNVYVYIIYLYITNLLYSTICVCINLRILSVLSKLTELFGGAGTKPSQKFEGWSVFWVWPHSYSRQSNVFN